MSEEKQPQEEAQKPIEDRPVEEVVTQAEKGLEEEIDVLASEADATELPSAEVIDAEIDAEEDASPSEEEDVVSSEPKVIEKKEYETLSKEELLEELQRLLKEEKVQDIKEHVEEIDTAINNQFDAEQEVAKNAFLEEGGNIIDFRYFSPLKKAYNETYYEYRNKRSNYYQNRQKDQKANLAYRQQLIEEVKQLREELGGEESLNTTFNKFKDIQERWHNAGNIPRDRYNLVWNNYYHHIDSFYELLHLNRAFRDKHFADNLTKKLQLIARAEELSDEPNINRAFKQLQLLHRMWKEEIGPVAKEYSDEIWDKFSAATKKIHDRRDENQKEIEKTWVVNLEVKNEIIKKIQEINADAIQSHKGVQAKIKDVEALRDAFFKAGKVPVEVNEETWSAFKDAVREFNHSKNDFYKSQKQTQYDNLNKKKELIKVAEEHMNSDDFPATIELMKKIQADWKKIGHVPRKDSDKVWKQFKDACNFFFNRLHESKKQSNAGEEEALEKKKALLDEIKELKLEGEHQEKLDIIKAQINTWKEIGRVPYAKKKIDEHFNKALDGLFKQLDIDKKEVEMIKYENRMQSMASEDNTRSLEKERFFITKKIQEIKSEINQLENNLGFFQHVSDDNPMVKEVHKNINAQKESLDVWSAKLRKIKTVMNS